MTFIFFTVGYSYQSTLAPFDLSFAIYSHPKTLVLKNSSYSLVSFKQIDSSCLYRILKNLSLVVNSGPMAINLTFLLERRSSMMNLYKGESLKSGWRMLYNRCLFMRLDKFLRSFTSYSFSRSSCFSRRKLNIYSMFLKVKPRW